jgi:transcriptional regulator with XRE-family HTH domain
MASVSERHPGGRPRTVRRCELGQKIEKLAAAKGLHIDEVAAAAGISTPGLYLILTGDTQSPRLATIKAIAAALGVKLDKLA